MFNEFEAVVVINFTGASFSVCRGFRMFNQFEAGICLKKNVGIDLAVCFQTLWET